MITNPSHTITFGAITMVEEGANPPDESGVIYVVRAQDTSHGNPAPVTVALLSLMRAGSLVSYDHTENRQPVLRVTIKADDSDLLARGERALQLECEKPTTLTWTPPDGAGETSVFDIVWSQLELVLDDLQELRRERTYLVRLQALPHARGSDPVITAAQPVGTLTMVDTGSSTTGWSAYEGYAPPFGHAVTVSVVSGKVTLTDTSGSAAPLQWIFQRTGSFSVTGKQYLVLDGTKQPAHTLGGLRIDGHYAPLVATVDLGGGATRWYFQIPTTVVDTATTFFLGINGAFGPGSNTFAVDQVQTADGLPFIGTLRQKALSLAPGGSIKTNGSIQVAHDTDALGKTVVYSHLSGTGYLPPLRLRLTQSESVTPDATTLSGARHLIGPATFTRYSVPVTALPKGRVELWARVRATTSIAVPGIIRWAVGSKMGAADLSYELYSTTYAFAVLNTWYLIPLGVATMPPVDLGPAGFVAVDLHEIDTSLGIEVDEAYLFATDQGSLTIVDCGTGSPAAGGPSNRLWIDAPSLELPMGGVYRGTSADRSDAFHAGADADVWGLHDFDPAGTSIFVATEDATDAETSLEHYRRYHTHVFREQS